MSKKITWKKDEELKSCYNSDCGHFQIYKHDGEWRVYYAALSEINHKTFRTLKSAKLACLSQKAKRLGDFEASHVLDVYSQLA